MSSKSETLFIKRSLGLFSVVAFLGVFFVIYNTYLVDRSIINLRAALTETEGVQTLQDLQKIKALLKLPLLKEISKKTTSPETLLSLETAENISTTASDMEQVEDIKLFLQTALKEEEKQRGGFLSFLDQINAALFKPELDTPREQLQDKAQKLLTRINSLSDNRALQEAYYQLGNIYLQMSDLPGAEKAFLKVVSLGPDTNIALKSRFNLAWAYKAMGQYDKALSYFEELGKELPDMALAVTSKYGVADTLYKKGEYTAARDKYAQLAKENPGFETSVFSLFQSGSIPLYKLNDFKTTLRFLYEFALSRAGSISLSDLQDIEGALKNFSELEEKVSQTADFRQVKTRTRDILAKDFRRRGYKPLREKNYQEAIENFKKAIGTSPSDGRSYSGLSLCYYWMDEKREALYYAKKALEASGGDEVTLTNILFLYINYGAMDEAIRIGEAFLSKRAQAVRRPEFYYNLGYAYLFQNKYNQASTYFDRAIRLNKEFSFAYNNLGCVFWSVKNYSEAIKRFKEAIVRNPAYADAYYNLGVVYYHLNLMDDAYNAFAKALDINPGYEKAQNYLVLIGETGKFNK